MDQTQTQTVDNDLQKAIDDITNTTNIDPVFSDPVAAPSSIPEGDTGELAESVGPFPEPKVEMVTPNTEATAPLDPLNLPELPTPEENPVAPIPEPLTPPAPIPEPITPPILEATSPEPFSSNFNFSTTPSLNTHKIKEAALRDLVPLIGHLNMDPIQKFHIYRDIFENLHDYAVLEPAYHAATEIPNETARAEALLYLIESIDRM